MSGVPPLFGRGGGVRYIGGFAYNATTTSPTPASMGAIVGDLTFYASLNSGPSGSGWISAGNDGAFQNWWKLIDQATVGAGVTGSTSGVLLIYRGPTSLSNRFNYNAPLTQSVRHLGFLNTRYSNDFEAVSSPVSNFVRRLTTAISSSGNQAVLDDRLLGSAPPWPAGTAVNQGSSVFELLGG